MMLNRDRALQYGRWASALCAVAAIAFLPLAAWTMRLVALHSWDGIEWNLLTGDILSVHQGGPAHGILERGDTIVAVDGVTPRLASPIYAGLSFDDHVRLTIVRDGVTKTACEDCDAAANTLVGE